MTGNIHEECGVAGIYGLKSDNAASLVYYGLFALQHRGQESCGIAVAGNSGDGQSPESPEGDGQITCRKAMGHVGDVFDSKTLSGLKGGRAIGHVRYSTTGNSVAENAQPLVAHFSKGSLAVAHNGNLTNTSELRKELEDEGAIFRTTVDSEIISYLTARYASESESVEEAVTKVMGRIRGGYALLVLCPDRLIAVRDPYGLKPLVMGEAGGATVFASESCAIEAMGGSLIRDIKPGEIVTVSADGISSIQTEPGRFSKCVFEYIYFARPDSVMDGISVYESRIRAGRLLARQHPVEADIVTGVPESGIDAALGYAEESGIPYVKAFVKNSYVGRTFIKPSQDQREQAVKIKLNPISSAVKGKRVIMTDDSIVRGTTIGNIVRMLRAAGATEVHVRISSPPFLHPCCYGTDVPSCDLLIACHHSIPEICSMIGADSLGYLDVKSLPDMLGEDGKYFCDACFTGDYPDSFVPEG